jgi:S-adenosylmethionine hydrolase
MLGDAAPCRPARFHFFRSHVRRQVLAGFNRMTPPALITLTTDFGVSSPYVAIMKGVMLSINPAVNIVDITHAVPPQDVAQGAIVLAEATRWFPPRTLHVAVVDPGVGGQRQMVYAEFGEQAVLGPDNGLFTRLAQRVAPSTIIALEQRAHWLPAVSKTFHGRDILAPVAAKLSLGLDPNQLGPRLESLILLPQSEVIVSGRKITGRVDSIDSFGNLVTDITDAQLADVPRGESTTVTCDEHETLGIFSTYSDQPVMTLIALVGSSGRLELAIVNENASMMLGVRVGTPVVVSW